jgi:hypothetical protein
MFLRKLPGNVTEQLIAPGSELMKHITTNAVASQQISARDAGRKLSGGYTLPSSTQVSAKEQLVQQIQNAVEAAVRKTLSQVDAPKKSNSEPPIPTLNFEDLEEDTKVPTEKGTQAQPAGPALLQDNLLQPQSIAGVGLKPEYQTPTSSVLSLSPDPQFRGMAEPILLHPAGPTPEELEWRFPLDETTSDSLFQHTARESAIPEPGRLANIWDNSLTIPSGGIYASTSPGLNLPVSGPAIVQNQGPFSVPEAQLENFQLDSWDFEPIRSADSGYESIVGPSDSNGLENLDTHYLFFQSDLQE